MAGIQDKLQRAFDLDARLGNFTPSEKLLLFHLAEPVRMGEIAQALHCLPSNVTPLVDQLEKKGLIRREPCPDDRRAKRLVLSDEGQRARLELIEAASKIFSEVTGLNDDEIKQLISLFNRRAQT